MRTSIILVALALAACSDDAVKDALGGGGEDAGTVEVQVEADAGTVQELSDDTKNALCDTVTNAANDGVSLYQKCDLAGLTAAATAAAEGLDAVRERCADAVDTCQTAASTGGSTAESQVPEISLPGCNLFKGDTSTCDKPLALLETCLTNLANAAAETVKSFDCTTLTIEGAQDNGLDALGSAIPNTPACAELRLDCPGIFETGGNERPDFTQGTAAEGEQYFNRCTACHGADGTGVQSGDPATSGTSLVVEVPGQSDDQLYDVITKGYEKMVAVQGLTDDQIVDLMAWLRAQFPAQ